MGIEKLIGVICVLLAIALFLIMELHKTEIELRRMGKEDERILEERIFQRLKGVK